MKPFISHLAAICSATIIMGLPLQAQNNAPRTGAAPATPSVSQDVKEKAEDAALLQQLDAEQPARSESRNKAQRDALSVGRGSGGAAGMSYRVQNLITRSTPAARALVVRTGDPDPKTQASLEEDLAVMSHLLSKAFEELPGGHATGGGGKVMGIDVFFTPGVTPLRSLYLDNYGAVFFLSVNFPLVAPSEKRDENKPAADATWEDARQELYGQRQKSGEAGDSGEEYSQEKVDKLKETVLEVLKNATNIRGLKPQEFVTIWVAGGSSAHGGKVRLKGNPGSNKENFFVADAAAAAGRRTVLTVRVTKAEIDEYAKGKLPAADFQKRARITAYTGETGANGPDGFAVGFYPARGGF